MLELGQRGAATIVAMVALVAVAGGTVGVPVIVDRAADQRPGAALYGLEIAGERIQEAFSRGQEWDLERAMERIHEYEQVAKREVTPQNHANFIEEVQNRVMKAAGRANNVNGLERARETIREQIRVLEKIKENAPEGAKQALERAITRSRWQERVLENLQIQMGQRGLAPGHLKQSLENKMITWENLKETLENRRIPPGILKQILENRDIPMDNLEDFLAGRRIPYGIVMQILENEDFENAIPEQLRERLEKKIGPIENLDEHMEK
ncbi:hypothetical protein AKJ37_06380 [candidate division MSBL1 archaeon SCGC-AAA259I09]|nr:hypothetical protein AKJ37_06380 [candidate division MSBL1 archaeon SCGC-AAA259I09]